MGESKLGFTRRRFLEAFGAASATLAAGQILGEPNAAGQEPQVRQTAPEFTGPGANPYWTSPGQSATYPQKAPLILLTDRPVQLETPRHYFSMAFTPNKAFYVRWHLEGIPNAVDLKNWKLQIEGNVNNPLALSLPELMQKFKPVSLAAVNQCSGNSRSRLQPRVP